jgi:manganese/zinc/iron transport system permease protein
MVLAGFYAVGICLVTMIQRLPQGNKAGVDKFLFGQASAMGPDDLKLMAVVTLIAVVVLFLFYKEFLAISFDHAFAHVSGFPTRLLHYGMMLLLAFSVVIALQAVGVVLVSAMLITPAAAAYLLTDRLHRMLWLAALFGMVSGALVAASLVFGCAFLFAPRHGVVVRWVRRRSRARRVQRENTLKAIYHVLEDRDFFGEGVSLNELAERRRETVEDASQLATRLVRHGLATLHEDGDLILLTPEGMQRASAIVRNHRLWELYLTNAASIAADHVHEDAEKIEHVLGEETVRKLERRLAFATRDPHGRAIPSTADIQKISKGGSSPEEVTGYGRRS